jgi:hypothetical protein
MSAAADEASGAEHQRLHWASECADRERLTTRQTAAANFQSLSAFEALRRDVEECADAKPA